MVERKFTPEILKTSAIARLIKMVDDGDYKCNYPDDPYIKNITSAEEVFDLENRLFNKSGYWYNTDEEGRVVYDFPNKGDLLKDLVVFGINGYIQVELLMGDVVWYTCSYLRYSGDLVINPFSFGIPVVSTIHSHPYLRVKGKHTTVGCTYIYLDTNERRKMCSPDDIPVYYPNGYRTIYGMFGQANESEENKDKRKAEENNSEEKVAKKRKRN